jgi:multidrug resistance efflux pump
MTIMKRLFTLFLLLFIGSSSVAIAATISERVDMAHRRIEQGMRSGALSREEAHRLRAEFSQVRHDEARARADGHLDRRERERLHHELGRLERHISQYEHNDVYRGDGRDHRRHYR